MKQFLFVLISFFFIQEKIFSETIPQDSVIINKLSIVNKILKDVISKEIKLIPIDFQDPLISTILVSIIKKEEKRFDVFVSISSSKIDKIKILRWYSMLTPYRYQQFVGLAKFQGYDIFIFGNQEIEFYKIKGKTHLPEYFHWLPNLNKMKFSNPFCDKEGKILIYFDPYINHYEYYNYKLTLDREYDSFDYIFDED